MASSAAAAAAAAASVEVIDVAPLFGVEPAAAAEAESQLFADGPVVNAVQDRVGDTSGAHRPHREDVEPLRRRPGAQAAQRAQHVQQGQDQHR